MESNGEKARPADVRPPLSPADSALRERITELSVHIPCGRLRGPVHKPDDRWQSCNCEDAPRRWDDRDVSSEYDLCLVCTRATAGSSTRWAWLACEDCRAVSAEVTEKFGARPFALGRHGAMNVNGMFAKRPPGDLDHHVGWLERFPGLRRSLADWHRSEYRLLASVFDSEADIPLTTWQRQWPPGPVASRDAFNRLLVLDRSGNPLQL